MSQSRFSIVLVGVSALLRRPLVSRLRPVDGERSGLRWFSPLGVAFRFGVALGGLTFGLTFRRLPLSGLVLPPSASEIATRRVGLRAHGFRFSARTASELPSASWFFCLPLRGCRSAGWSSDSRLPLFGTHRFGVALCELVLPPSASELPLGGLAFGLTASAFRHAPLRSGRWAGWPSGSLLPLFGMRRSAPPCRRREGRRSTPTRHLFHFKTLIPTC